MKNMLSESRWIARLTHKFIRSILFLVLLEVILAISSVSIAVVSKMVIDFSLEGLPNKAILACITFACLILQQVGLGVISSIKSTRTHGVILNDLQQNMYKSISQAMWSDYTKYHSEDMMTRITNDAQLVAEGIVYVIPSIVALGVELASAFAVLFIFDPTLAVLSFCLGPLALLFNRFFGRNLKKIHVRMQESESKYRESLHESIQNMLVIKTFSLEERSLNHICKLQNDRLSWVLRKNQLKVAASSMLSLSYWLGFFLAFSWSAYGLYKGTNSFGTTIVFLQLVGQIQGPFIGLAYSYPQIVSMLASTGRIMKMQFLPSDNLIVAKPTLKTAGIEFCHVNFSYKKNIPILENVSFKIYPGEIVALVGPSGEGKTTLIQLILALLYPISGHIYLTDNHGEKWEANSSTRSLISYVPQGNTLFSGTIAENILVGNPKASLQELKEAIRFSDAWEFIKKLPDGLHTKLGEISTGLSEGQNQRIAIARAILRKTPILILDEPTSALDNDSEKKVLETLTRLEPARTCMIITHQSSALSLCNRMFKINNSQILEIPKILP